MPSELLSPPQPAFVLRGHSAHIHALHFTRGNQRLLTGDADGWIVSWNLAYKRPVAAWKGHANAILGLGSWGQDYILSHGRDSRLIVWQLGVDDEEPLSKTLPVDASASHSAPQPWMLYMLTVNTLNFCSFAMCQDGMPSSHQAFPVLKEKSMSAPILIAVPNTIDSGGIDVYQLPTESRAAVINADKNITTGMVMSLSISAETARIQVVAGFESGHVMVFVQNDPAAVFERLYCAQTHKQPVLSLSIAPCKEYCITSSADAVIAKHPLPWEKSIWNTDLKPLKVSQTKHSGQQGLQIRSDGMIFATAGWDSKIRVYSSKSLKEAAVLKWHKMGCYATAFADVTCHMPRANHPESDEPRGSNGVECPASEKSSAVSTVQERRDQKARSTHWLAAGSKDGKVSLWDIY